MKITKRIILFALTLLGGLGMSMISVHAASGLNANEQAIIATVQGGFMVDGVHYTVPSQYVNQGINYLNQDGIDITAEQKSTIINRMYQMVRTGIERGYLVSSNSSTDKSESINENSEETSTVAPVEITEEQDMEVGAGLQGIVDSAKDVISEMGVSVSFDLSNKQLSVVGVDGNTVMSAGSNLIKNTGFTMNATIYISILLLGILIGCICIICKYKLMEDYDES